MFFPPHWIEIAISPFVLTFIQQLFLIIYLQSLLIEFKEVTLKVLKECSVCIVQPS